MEDVSPTTNSGKQESAVERVTCGCECHEKFTHKSHCERCFILRPVVQIDRVWAMPNKSTFSILPIQQLLKEEMRDGYYGGDWIDPFAGWISPATHKNDINPEMTNAQYHEDAIEWLKKIESADGVLLDPPYALRQVSEHYKKAGIKVTGWHTSMAWGATLKDEAARIIRPGGKAICFGWNSMGLGKNRGFTMTRILLVAHGGSKNDTICTVETKNRP